MLDERFLMHRYKSTSHAAVAGSVAMGGWFLYQQWGRGVLRWDIMAILTLMAVVKVGAMLYYRRFD